MTHPSHEFLQEALRGATDARQVVIRASVLPSVVEVLAQVFVDRSAVVIADENTFVVAGREVQRQLAAAHLHPIEPSSFPANRNCMPITGIR